MSRRHIPTGYDDEAVLQPKVPSFHVTLVSVKLTKKEEKNQLTGMC